NRGGCGCIVSYKAPGGSSPGPQTLYVATNGSDTNPGTITQPLQTIAAAIAKLPIFGVVYVRAGTYPTIGRLGLTVTGSQVLAMPGETVVIQYGNYTGGLFDVY